jgi:hypothetical protein
LWLPRDETGVTQHSWVERYIFIAEWLALDSKHPAWPKIKGLKTLCGLDAQKREQEIQAELARAYGLVSG